MQRHRRTAVTLHMSAASVQPLTGNIVDNEAQSWVELAVYDTAVLFTTIPGIAAEMMKVPARAPVMLKLRDAPR